MAFATIVSTLFIVGVSSLTDCDWGAFTGTVSDCQFWCEYSNYVDRTTLSFESIYNACPEVKEAADAGQCSGLQDLDWSYV